MVCGWIHCAPPGPRVGGRVRGGVGRSGGKESGEEAALGGGQALPSSNRPPAALTPPGTAFQKCVVEGASRQQGGPARQASPQQSKQMGTFEASASFF